MNQIYFQFVSQALSIWRRRWYAIAVAWLACGLGWTMVASLPDKYESSARIYVDMDTMLGPLMRGLAVEMNMFQQIDIMQRTLLSRPNMEKVVLLTDLDLRVHTEGEKQALIEGLAKSIKVEQQGRNLFKVSYQDTDPNMTKRVVQAVLQIFVESNLGASRKDMQTTQRFLEAQVRDYEKQLEEAESRRAKFTRENMGLLPGDGANYYSQMQNMRKQLETTEAQISEAETTRNELRQQLASLPATVQIDRGDYGSGMSAGPESDTQMRILQLEKVMDDLLMRYTDKHPDVLTTKRRLEQLREKMQEEQAAMAQMAPDPGQPARRSASMPNPVYEQVKLQLVQQETQIATLKQRVLRDRAEIDKWAKMAQLVPQVEQEMAKLNRDYTIIRDGYQQFRSRQESARLANDLETKAQKVQFRIIDPPQVPLAPSGPNRQIYLSMVLIAGLGVGIAFAFLVGQINQTFSTIQRLRSTFALPVLGGISAVLSPRERRRRVRELLTFSTVTASLVMAYVGLVSIENLGAERLVNAARGLGVI